METWTCIHCETNNKEKDVECLVCEEKKSIVKKVIKPSAPKKEISKTPTDTTAEKERKEKEKREKAAEKRRKATPQNAICTKNLGVFEYGVVSRNHTCPHCTQMLTFYNYGDFLCPACRKNIFLDINYTCKKCSFSMRIQEITHRYKGVKLFCTKCDKKFRLPKEFQIPDPSGGKRRGCAWLWWILAIVVGAIIYFAVIEPSNNPPNRDNASHSTTPNITQNQRTATVTATNLNIRVSPNANARVLGTAPRNSTVEIIADNHTRGFIDGSSGYWVRVRQGNTVGYVWGNHLRRTNATHSTTTINRTVSVSSVSLNRTSATLTVGATETLTATVSPSNATNRNVTWTSSNSNVATVNASGRVTAVAAGTATITARTADGGRTASTTITVQAPVNVNRPTARISNVWWEDGGSGRIRIVVEFSVQNMQHRTGSVTAWFEHRDGRRLIGHSTQHRTSDGQASVQRTFIPSYQNTIWNRFPLYMPRSELGLTSGNYELRFRVGVFDDNNNQMVISNYVYFGW